jgi:hypothetical protein
MQRATSRRALLVRLPLLGLCLWLWGRPGLGARAAEPSARLGRQEVNAEIEDDRGVAVTTIRQEVINGSGDEGGATCDLPIPDEAALMHFQVLSPPPRKGEQPAARGGVEAIWPNLYPVCMGLPGVLSVIGHADWRLHSGKLYTAWGMTGKSGSRRVGRGELLQIVDAELLLDGGDLVDRALEALVAQHFMLVLFHAVA